MVSKKITIINPNGLHARPASDFVQECTKYKSSIKISRVDDESSECDAKSIISVLLLGLNKGDEAVLKVEGEDEEEALNNIVSLIESGFGEA